MKQDMKKLGRKGGRARWAKVSKKKRSQMMRDLAIKRHKKAIGR